MANPSVAGALSRMKQLADQNPSLRATFLVLLRAEHKVALDKLLQEPHTDTVVRALMKVEAMVYWLHTIGQGPTAEALRMPSSTVQRRVRTSRQRPACKPQMLRLKQRQPSLPRA